MTTLTQQTEHGRIPLTHSPAVTPGIWSRGALWAAQIAAAGLFLFSGMLKLAGVPAMVQLFDAIGVGQWFRSATGTIEVASAVLLLVPSLVFYGALALAATMIGAIFTHFFIVGGSPALPGLLLAVTIAVAWGRRNER